MTDNNAEKLRAAIVAAAPTALATMAEFASDPTASMTTRLGSIQRIVHVCRRFDWKPQPQQAAAIVKFLRAVTADGNRAEGTCRKAHAYLQEGARLNLWSES